MRPIGSPSSPGGRADATPHAARAGRSIPHFRLERETTHPTLGVPLHVMARGRDA